MNIPTAFKYNQNTSYRVGGVYDPNHNFSLVNQTIYINKQEKFNVHFQNIWTDYKLPRITSQETYNQWMANQMQFWQNQLNFVVWCATSGCGVSKTKHLNNSNTLIKSVFRFHTYYQIRRLLNQLQCPLPGENPWNPLNNAINMAEFKNICSEFGISPQSDFRQKLDFSHGLGAVRYYSLHGLRSKPTKELERGGDYDPSQKWTVFIPSTGKFGHNTQHRYKIEYIEQYFSKGELKRMRVVDPETGSPLDAIGSFILDEGNGFTQAGITRINDSIRTYVWAILGAQSQARSSILGSGKAFDAQKQFLANVEDAINSAVDLPSSIERYQSTLQYARSKVDFVIGENLYMLPSNMDLHIGTINGYNNLIVIASPNLQLGQNSKVNDETVLQKTPTEFDTDVESPSEFDDPVESKIIVEPQNEFVEPQEKETVLETETNNLTHEENKLLLTLGGVIAGPILIWMLK